MTVNLNPATILWIILNSIGLFYALSVYFRAYKKYTLIKQYKPLVNERRSDWLHQQQAVRFQARLNVTVAWALSVTLMLYLLLGLFTMFFARPGILYYGYIIQFVLIAGDMLVVFIANRLDYGQTKLHKLVDIEEENKNKG